MYQNTDAEPVQVFEKLHKEAEQRRRRSPSTGVGIQIGLATCGIAAGALETKEAFERELAQAGVQAHIRTVGCVGHCYAEPVVVIDHPESGMPPLFYQQVGAGKVKMLVRRFLLEADPCLEHVLGATVPNELLPTVMDFARFNLEKRIVMEKCGSIDPQSIDEYFLSGGYGALAQALGMPAEQVIEVISDAGLRGRGGAGFSTGRKWQRAAQVPGPEKYFVCNADEGDPGAYMDRTILESNPHQVIEGIIIGAYAVGAHQAVIYVRAEYPLAVKTLQTAISQARSHGLLGRSILGSGFELQLELFQGSGAFVCGEETALIRSMEGFRGMPRHRPPYPVEQGFNGRPTVINNVKTLATVAPVITNGAQWFRKIGTPESPGTAIFSVVGDVIHPGLVEVPMGVTLRHLIFDVCGGIANKRKFKAVQIGGPSGGCLSDKFLDTPIDFDSLTGVGAMMGSGGLVVMDEDNCMVDVARFFLEFTQKESCGKCTFCRIGTKHMLSILERLTQGQGREGDIELLARIGADTRAGSLCGLGQTAPNPVLTSIEYFADEYQAHLDEKRCPGLTCRALTAFYIDLVKCARGCDACVGCCPVDAVFTTSTRKKGIDQSLCVKCGECMVACPPDYDAVRKVSPPQLAPVIERPAQPPGES
jgi:NADH-quinone oxidoreductase subunit F